MVWTAAFNWERVVEARSRSRTAPICDAAVHDDQSSSPWRRYNLGGPTGVHLVTLCDICGRTPLEVIDARVEDAAAPRRARREAVAV